MDDVTAFQPYLVCSCGNRIELPLTIPSENAPHQTPWPAGKERQTFVCLQCMRASEYSRSSVLRSRIQTLEGLQSIRDSAVFQLALSCGHEGCAGLVEIHAVLPKDSEKSIAASLASKIYAADIPCTKCLYRHTGPSIGRGAIGFAIDQDWAVLA
jgi:hypothetical protein